MTKKYLNNLKKYRKKRGLKQQDVAQILGLKDPTNISRWENGVRIPDVINMFKLSILYNVSVDNLFPGVKASMKVELLSSYDDN